MPNSEAARPDGVITLFQVADFGIETPFLISRSSLPGFVAATGGGSYSQPTSPPAKAGYWRGRWLLTNRPSGQRMRD